MSEDETKRQDFLAENVTSFLNQPGVRRTVLGALSMDAALREAMILMYGKSLLYGPDEPDQSVPTPQDNPNAS